MESNLIDKARSGDLVGKDLSKSNWAGQDFSGARLAGAILAKGKFRKTNFSGADFSGADLSRADLRGADLTNANFSGAKLEKADLDGANLTDAVLDNAILTGAKAREANFENTRALKAIWRDALVSKSHFKNVDFRNAEFVSADLVETSWEKAELRGANLDQSIWINAELSEVRAAGVNGVDVDFFLSQVRDSDFTGAVLTKSNWSSTRLERVSFKDANLGHAQFSGGRHEDVDFADAELKSAILKSVKGYDEPALVAFRERGAKTSSLIWLRMGKTLRTNRLAQAAVAVLVLSALTYGWIWYSNPENWSYTRLEQAAGDAMSKQDIPRAMRCYKIILEKYADDPFRMANIRVQLASLHLGLNEIDKAREYFELVVKDAADRPELKASLFSAELGLADALAQERRYDEAIKAFTEFADRWNAYPESSRAWERIAQIENLQGNVEAAETAYLKIINARQYSSDAIFNANLSLARLWKEHLQGPKAIAKLEEILSQNVDIPQRASQILAQQIEIMVAMGDLDGAQTKLVLIKERFSDQKDVILGAENAIAEGEKSRGQPELAVARYERLLSEAKEPVQIGSVASTLANVLKQLGRNDDALKVIESALLRVKSADEQVQHLTLDRATVLLALRRHDEAAKLLEDLRSSVKDQGARQNASVMLAGVYRNRGQYDKAKEILGETLKEAAGSTHMEATIRQTLGDIEWETNNAEAAIAQFRQVWELTKDLNLNFNPDLNILSVYRQSHDLVGWKSQLDLMTKRYAPDAFLAAKTRSEGAEYLKQIGKSAEAEAIWREISQNQQADIALGALRSLQMMYSDQGRIADLDAIAKSIEERFPTRTDDLSLARMAKAESLVRDRQFDAALVEFQALAATASVATARQSLSRVMDIEAQRGNLVAVQTAFDRAIAMPAGEPGGRASLIQKLAGAMSDSGRYADALAMLEKETKSEKDPRERVQLLQSLAAFYDRGSNPAQAEKTYDQVVREFPEASFVQEVAQARYSLGQLLERRGDLAAAKSQYEAVVSMPLEAGIIAQTRASLVRVMASQGQVDAAAAMIEEVRKQGSRALPAADAMTLALGETLSRNRQIEQAVRTLDPLTKATDRPAVRKQALNSVAQAYTNAQEWEKARTTFEKIAEDYTDDDVIADQARMGIAWTYKSENRAVEAMSAYETAAKSAKSPESRLNAFTEMIALAVDAGDDATVTRIATEITRDFANRPEAIAAANAGVAQIARRENRIDDAAVAWRKNLELNLPAGAQLQITQQIAQMYVETGRASDAEKLLVEAKKRFPTDAAYQADVAAALAQVVSASGRAGDAIKLLGEVAASSTDPGRRINASFQLAQLLRQNNRVDEALGIFDKLEKESGLEGGMKDQILTGRAETYRQAKRYDEAVKTYLAIAEKGATKESKSWALNSAAQCYVEQNRFDDAVKLYQDMIARAGGDTGTSEPAQIGLANALKQAGRVADALATLETLKAATTDPVKRLKVDQTIARMYQESGRLGDAILIFRSILASKDAEANLREESSWELAQCLRQSKKLDESLDLFKKLAQEAKSPETRRQSKSATAQIQAEKGDIAAAKSSYDALIAAESDATEKAKLSTELGGLFQASGQPKDAAVAFRRSIELAPKSLAALWATQSLAQLAMQAGEMSDARKYFEQILSNPIAQSGAKMNARFGLAELSKRAGKRDDEIKQYQLALSEAVDDTDRSQVMNMLAQAYADMKKPAEARGVYETVIGDSKATPLAGVRARIGLGQLLRSSGDEAKARETFLAAANILPKEPVAGEAIQAALASDLEMGDVRAFDEHLALLRERFPNDQNAVDSVLQLQIEKSRGRNQWDQALASLDALLAQTKDPERRRWANFTKGQCLSGLGRYDEARAVFQAIVKDPESDEKTVLQARLGDAHNERDRGDNEAAATIFWDIAKANPDSPHAVMALFDLAQLYQQDKTGDLEKVFQAIIASKAANEQDLINAHMGLAAFYAQKQKVSSAVKEYQVVYDTWPDKQDAAWALSSAAMLLKTNGDQSQAVRLLERLIKNFPPEHEAVTGAKQTLAEIYKR